MAVEYACLQVNVDTDMQAAQERLLYAITACMDARGLIPCHRDSAERTVAFVATEAGYTVYDDGADRQDERALDELGRALTRKMETRAIGVMGGRTTLLLRLYVGGTIRDTYRATAQVQQPHTGFCHRLAGEMLGRVHAVRWQELRRSFCTVRKLEEAFVQGRDVGRAALEQLQPLLGLDQTTSFGFASLEDAGIQGVTELYFCVATRIRQSVFARLRRPVRTVATTVGAFFHRPVRDIQ